MLENLKVVKEKRNNSKLKELKHTEALKAMFDFWARFLFYKGYFGDGWRLGCRSKWSILLSWFESLYFGEIPFSGVKGIMGH